MKGSQSAPAMHAHVAPHQEYGGSIHATLRTTKGGKAGAMDHRGAHEIGAIHHDGATVHPTGTISGLHPKNDIYIPRAPWTESHDGTMMTQNRNHKFDPHQFLKEEALRQGGQERRKTYLNHQYDHGFNETAIKQATTRENHRRECAQLDADIQRDIGFDGARKAELARNNRLMKEANDEKLREMQRCARDQRAQEAREMTEMKLRTVLQMNEQLQDEENRKARNKKAGDEMLALIHEREQKRKGDKITAAQVQRQTLRDSILQDEYRLMGQSQRWKAAQDEWDVKVSGWVRTAGKADAERERLEKERLERDELRLNLAKDSMYAAREKHRVLAKERALTELKSQSMSGEKKKLLEQQRKEMDRETVNEMTRQGIEAEYNKMQHKHGEECRVQREQLANMAAHQRAEEKEEYRRPPHINTMANLAKETRKHRPPVFKKADIVHAIPQKVGSQTKPRPAVDISNPVVYGGVVGVFGGEGGSLTISLNAMGGKGAILTGGNK